LTPKQRRKLERAARSRKAESGLVERVRIVLLAAKGVTNLEISRRVGCTAKNGEQVADTLCQKQTEETGGAP
jgi:hypothetical protein